MSYQNHSENLSPNLKNGLSSPNVIHCENKDLKLSWIKKYLKEDVRISEIFKMCLAELIGTGILVFLGCMGCVGSLGHRPSPLQISFTFGLAVMVIIQSIGHISAAHINPAITLGSVVLGKKSLPIAILYIFAQLVGAIIGFGLLKSVTPEMLLHSGNETTSSEFCVTDLHNNISMFQGFVIEVIATGILMLMTCGVWDARQTKFGDSVSIKFGLAVAVICMAVGPYTGCSMNPARSLAPAIWNNHWSNHWVFWFGPFVGSLLASLFYRFIFWPQEFQEMRPNAEAYHVSL
ncbi:aquaporin-like [Leptopilina heterotoma]|uniref:aquaporin-like n=1 Tax=Leptopilina heterotoma TaxID=63436 RepID=UPI001CA7FE68|nr:aquaporin-like [Leptopilina heterotoma]XP_043463461.1 aquaporin-like [Leptopilina heterotoma]XP_043463462.1 aquaporin-like [Leptopilina heterotoma]XP_043463463.1 aquaporin-like [Leptopilina heterotoma]XP_043463464.1 aquaporin-like [Leptopilina heterotoma]XP_043463465.1 aquaporin-like [Leptopilina heterotoma]